MITILAWTVLGGTLAFAAIYMTLEKYGRSIAKWVWKNEWIPLGPLAPHVLGWSLGNKHGDRGVMKGEKRCQ